MGNINDLEKKAKERVEKEISLGINKLGIEEWENLHQPFSKKHFGRCHNCVCLLAVRTTFDRIVAKCSEFDVRLSADDPVEECTCWVKRGVMDLRSMTEIAIILDPFKKTLGF